MRVLVMALVAMSGCASAADRYRDEQIACVVRYAPSQAEIDACRAGVRAAAGLPPRGGFDAGR